MKCLYLFRNAFDQNRMTTKMMNDEQRVQLPIVGDNGDAYAFELLVNIAHGRNALMFYQKEERTGGKTSD